MKRCLACAITGTDLPCGRYHLDNTGLDDLANAGYPHKSWWKDVLVEDPEHPNLPYIQREPAVYSGFFVAKTALRDPDPRIPDTNPEKYVDATRIPYIVYTGDFYNASGTGQLGDLAFVVSTIAGKTTASAIIANSVSINGSLTATKGPTTLGEARAASVRVDGPPGAGTSLSLGGNGDLSVDAPQVVAGRFVVKNGGNVGINTPNPTSQLEVNGTATVSSLTLGPWSLSVDSNSNLVFKSGTTSFSLSANNKVSQNTRMIMTDHSPIYVLAPSRGNSALNATSHFRINATGFVATTYWSDRPDGDSNLVLRYGNPF